MNDVQSLPPEDETLDRREMEALIIKKVWSDEAFRQEFLADPKGTIEKYAQMTLPENIRISVHEEDENSVHIVIPAKPMVQGELSDDDLESVAGGVDVGGVLRGIAGAIKGISTAVNVARHVTNRVGW